jgi:hypothetical protein
MRFHAPALSRLCSMTEPRHRPDACPYPKPFRPDFTDCPAFQPVSYLPTDSLNHPLKPTWTCGHLDVVREESGRPFARCRLGSPADRVRWVDELTADRVERWRAVAREFGEALQPRIGALYAAKSAQLAAAAAGEGQAEANQKLREEMEAFLKADFALLDARVEELADIGFPVEGVKVVTTAAMEALVERRTLAPTWQPPDELLRPFAPRVGEFLRSLFAPSPQRDL